MRGLVVTLAACVSLIACAPVQPPAQPTQAELATRHQLYINGPRSRVVVDADTSVAVPTFMPLSPLGLLVGAAATLAVVAVQAPGALSREAEQEALHTAAGDTAEVAQLFTERFRQALREATRDVPSLELQDSNERRTVAAAQGGPRLSVDQDIVFTPDARMLVARAALVHDIGEGPGRRTETRRFLVFSVPTQAPAGAEAIAAWTADGGRPMRDEAVVLARELAALIRNVALEPGEQLAMERLPLTTLRTPGVGLLLWDAPNGRVTTHRLPRRLEVRVQQRANGRSLLVAPVFRSGLTFWTWLSVPDAVLDAPPAS